MQTVRLKYDVISWITGLEDRKLIQKLYLLMKEQRFAEISMEGASRKKSRNLTKGYGIWADEAPFNETDYRDKIWQQEKNVW